MSRVYVATGNYTSGTATDYIFFELATGAVKIVIHEIWLTSANLGTPIPRGVLLARRSTASSGGLASGVEIELLDAQSPTTTVTVTRAGTVGTLAGELKNWLWNHVSPLIYRPLPDDRVIIAANSWVTLTRASTPIGGDRTVRIHMVWEEL